MSDDAHDDAERNRATLLKPDDQTFRSPPGRNVDPVIGLEVSGYRIKGRLGAGGMGIVYEGEQPMIGKRVAIKVLRPEVADNPDVVRRLVAEARAVNAVGHRNIIDVFGFGELPDGRQCIVMEYLDGDSLEAVLKTHAADGRVMPTLEVLIVLDEMLGALAAAHAAGVIHRDLKPSNIFLCRQRDGAQFVKLLDFGIAKLGLQGKPTPQTRASLLMGTPSYMAPEQARGGAAGPGMDLYAVGVIAYEMLTGRLPFTAETVMEMLLKHANEVPTPPTQWVRMPGALDALVVRLLAKKAEDRFASAGEVREQVVQLRKALADPGALRVSPDDETIVPASRRRSSMATPALALEAARVAPLRAEAPEAAEEPIALPARSSAPLVVGLAVVAVVLGGGALWVFSQPTLDAPAPVQPSAVAMPPPVEAAAPPRDPAEPRDVAAAPAPAAPPEPSPQPALKPQKPRKPVEAVAKPPPPDTPKPARPAGPSLEARLKALSARLEKAEAAGASVGLYRKQVELASKALAGKPDADSKDRLEALIARLETSSEY